MAADADDRAQGLMEMESLPENIDGMLFVFETPGEYSFWMLHTLMPLDIWWFDSDRILIGSTAMPPCEIQPCPSYPPPGAILYALETPASSHEFENGAVLNR